MFHLDSQTKMGSAIVDLWRLLLSKKGQEEMTIQEANLLVSWQNQTMRSSLISFAGANTVAMLVTPRRLNILVRCGLSLGASMVCTLSYFGRSLESWTDHFLSLEGSRVQIVLANIMLNKYNDDPWVLRRLSKHFYLEEVYEDSSADKPKCRWHSRYFYGDSASHFQNASYNDMKTDSRKNDVEKTTVESKEVYVNTATAADVSENPFDFVFGLPGSAENIPSPKTSSTSSGRSSLRERRSRRRHRRHHQEDSDV